MPQESAGTPGPSEHDDALYRRLIDSAVTNAFLGQWSRWSAGALNQPPVWGLSWPDSIEQYRSDLRVAHLPGTRPELERALRNLSHAMGLANLAFLKYHPRAEGDKLLGEAFYRKGYGKPDENEVMARYDAWIQDCGNSVLEATKAANWLAEVVRDSLDKQFLNQNWLSFIDGSSQVVARYKPEEKQARPAHLHNLLAQALYEKRCNEAEMWGDPMPAPPRMVSEAQPAQPQPSASTVAAEESKTQPKVNQSTVRPAPIPVSEIRGCVHAAIITIRSDEYEAVESHFPGSIPVEGGNNSYELATMQSDGRGQINVVVTRCVTQGNTRAQAVANNIIADLDPSWLFLVGIAGGVPDNEFSLGDVIVASALHDFSFGAAAEGGKGTYETGGGPMHQQVERILQTKITGKNRTRLEDLAGFNSQPKFLQHPQIIPAHLTSQTAFYGDPAFQDDVKRKLARRFPNWKRKGPPLLWSGPCANGNLLVKDSELLKQWQESARQIVHVETELAGVYEAARSAGRQNYPLLAIRGLSDIVGLKRDPDWTQYACETAAATTYAVLKSGFIDLAQNLPGHK